MDHPEASPTIIPCGKSPRRKEGEKVNETAKKEERCGRFSYSVLVAEHPFVLFFATLAVIVICALCDFVPEFGAPAFPDFSTPVMGFEARGTTINKRWRTRLFLKIAIGRDMLFSVPPIPPRPSAEIIPSITQHCPTLNLSAISARIRRDAGYQTSSQSLAFSRKQKRSLQQHSSRSALHMCDSPNVYMKSKIEYKTIFEPIQAGANMMNAKSLKAVCRLESRIIREFPGYDKDCFKRNVTVNGAIVQECCPSWSVGNYVASLTSRTSCQDIRDDDITTVLKRLRQCARLFHSGTLKENCWDYKNARPYPYCHGIPIPCIQDNAVFNILYYLTDKDFLGKDMSEHLSYTQVFTPRWQRRSFSEKIYYKYIEDVEMKDGPVKLAGTDFFFLKFNMFNTKLLADIIYPSIALMIILVIMWFYTESILLTFLLAASVVSALILAYFFYMIVLKLDFFPFLNITTLIFLVGIGADDAFVYCDIWRQSKRDNPGASLRTVTLKTLKHASLSMFVTSLTTAAAFMANFSSEITTIKLFGLYAGVAILAKFSLMVTWFPAVCVIHEVYCNKYSCTVGAASKKDDTDQGCLERFRGHYEATFTKFSRYVFDDLLPFLIFKFRFFWIVLFLGLTAAGLFVLVGYPGLQLPSSSDFQMFAASHPLETYELYLKDKFRFELSPSQESATFPIDMFWGIEPEDYGDQLNPYHYGKFGWDKSFDIISPASQRWLMEFCQRFRSQDFYARKAGSEKKCFIEVFYNQTCSDPLVPELCYYPCCKNSTFPFSRDVLDFCVLTSAYQRKLLKFKVQDNMIGSFIYDHQGHLKGLWIRIMSNVRLSRAYQPAHEFWQRIEIWVRKEMSNAPPGMRNGWFVSDLEFYNLQQSLSRGTLLSLSISIATAFAVMLLTTWNLFVSLYAIVTIIGIISVTIGSLVLSGWKLNIIESITMSVAVGVSIDFSMHFGVAYCLAPDKHSRTSRVRYSLSRMGSAITMAAVTTFIAGALMMPSDVLSYIQMGHFLMLVMTVSWAFSVFFFQSLCCTIGPQGNMGQLSLKQLLSCIPCIGGSSSKEDEKDEESLKDSSSYDEDEVSGKSGGEAKSMDGSDANEEKARTDSDDASGAPLLYTTAV